MPQQFMFFLVLDHPPFFFVQWFLSDPNRYKHCPGSNQPAPSIQGDDFPGPTQMWGGLELKLLTLGDVTPAQHPVVTFGSVRFVILCLNLRFVFGMF